MEKECSDMKSVLSRLSPVCPTSPHCASQALGQVSLSISASSFPLEPYGVGAIIMPISQVEKQVCIFWKAHFLDNGLDIASGHGFVK